MNMDHNHQKSRYLMRSKRRKVNIVLNSLIVIVLLLIALIGGYIFLGDTKTEKVAKEQAEKVTLNESKPVNANETQDDGSLADEQNDNKLDSNIVVTESQDSNVEQVITNPDWKPVGTEQVNGHESSYQKDTIDWNEKLEAGAYALGTTVSNMNTWWVEGGEDPENEAILTLSARSSENVYRVYIEWVDGQGWKPTKMEKLIENDKR